MKKSLLLLAALACTGAVAQEKEIWACQTEAGTQLLWEDGRWNSYRVTDNQLLLTLDGANSTYKIGSNTSELTCTDVFGKISCFGTYTGSQNIFFDPDSGRMGMSYLFGAVIRADSVAAQVYNCTKF